MATLGAALLWLVAVTLFLAFPLSEWARSMASSGSHPPSKGAMIASLAGAVLIVLLI